MATQNSQQLSASKDPPRRNTKFPEIVHEPPSLPAVKGAGGKRGVKLSHASNEQLFSPKPGRPFDRPNQRRAEEASAVTKGERSPPTTQANQEKVSDNDSNASSTGVAITKNIKAKKNVAQKSTKPLRSKKQVMDAEDPKLLKYFDKVAPEKRLRNI